jgi:hypothetical protein
VSHSGLRRGGGAGTPACAGGAVGSPMGLSKSKPKERKGKGRRRPVVTTRPG